MEIFNYQTASRTILADLYTPVGVYMRLRDIHPQSALMESSDYHDKNNARSFIGVTPLASVAVSHGESIFTFPGGRMERKPVTDSYRVENALREFIGHFHVTGNHKAYCGLYGYTTFNAVRYFENIAVKDETLQKNDAPDVLYILYRDVLVFDHHNAQLTLVTLFPAAGSHGEADEGRARQGVEQLNALEQAINKTTVRPYDFHPVGDVSSPLTDEEHKANIRRGIQHCLRGDVFQIVLSRRFVQRFEGDDFKLYRALRSVNPSPYLFYFDFGGFRIFGSSPETHCRIERKANKPDLDEMAAGNAGCREESGREVSHKGLQQPGGMLSPADRQTVYTAYIDPIAGTTRRTGDEEADRKGAEYLRQDPKENAEHVMLVDLARNDLSRNCHDVKVDFYKDLQYYSHVIHLVSRVSGRLNHDADPIKAFVDTFPAGTLSGAPKVRAMQLISEYEPHNRGAYGGCIGYIGLDGDLNQAITIRTFVSRNGELWFQAGGGIVAKSDEDYELQEVNNKLGALRKAILMAEKM